MPGEVRKTLMSHMPNFKCEEIEASYKDGKIVAYEFAGTRVGEEFSVWIGADGELKVVGGEEDADDDRPSGDKPKSPR